MSFNKTKIKRLRRRVKNRIKRLFCKHSYEKVSWYEGYDPVRNMRYSIRTYRCKICGKKNVVDGRYDIICA